VSPVVVGMGIYEHLFLDVFWMGLASVLVQSSSVADAPSDDVSLTLNISSFGTGIGSKDGPSTQWT